MIQRKFKIGYNRTARIIDVMEQEGVIGAADGARPRQVLWDRPAESPSVPNRGIRLVRLCYWIVTQVRCCDLSVTVEGQHGGDVFRVLAGGRGLFHSPSAG